MRQTAKVTATAAEVITTKTPVAYAPPCASTPALKRSEFLANAWVDYALFAVAAGAGCCCVAGACVAAIVDGYAMRPW